MAYEKKVIGSKIRIKREELAYTQEEVAAKIGCSLGFYSRVERGITGMSVETLMDICQVLKTTPNAILYEPTAETDEFDQNRKWICDTLANCSAETLQMTTELLKVVLKWSAAGNSQK